MMKDLKVIFRLLGCSYSIVANLILGIICMLAGFSIEIISHGKLYVGAYLIIITGLWPIQMLFSVAVSNLVAASPWKRSLQTRLPLILNIICYFGMFTVLALLRLAALHRYPSDAGIITWYLLLTAVTGAMVLIYSAFSFKFFTASMIIFVSAYVLLTSLTGSQFVVETFGDLSYGAAVLLGYLILAAGILANYLIANLVYRRQFSKGAFGAGMRRYL